MWGERSLTGYTERMRWYTAEGRSRRYWAIYAVTAFVGAAAWTGTSLSHRAVDDRWLTWALAVTWFCAGVSYVVRARRSPSKRAEEYQPQSAPPPSE
jgi:hypothetical protein